MKILYARGVTEPHGTALKLTWTEFKDFILKSSIPKKNESDRGKRGNLWFSTAEFKDNYRNRDNLIGSVWAIVADLDAVHDPQAVKKILAPYEYLAWTTWRSTPKNPRWRIVIPIEGGINTKAYTGFSTRFLEKLKGIAKVDPRSFLAEQLWFAAEHKQSSAKHHEVWNNVGRPLKPGFQLDFTGVRLVGRPEEIHEGSRNDALVHRLNFRDALACKSLGELLQLAKQWNSKLPKPMSEREVKGIVKKKWNWYQDSEGIKRRSAAIPAIEEVEILDKVKMPDQTGIGLMSDEVSSAKLPDSLIGDFLFPGATMISAKMKEGKSFLTMQLAMSAATATPFLRGKKHPGFAVRQKKKALIIAGEDTAGGIAHRFHGNIAIGNLPCPTGEDDVRLLFTNHLDEIRASVDSQIGSKLKVSGCWIFEKLVDKWYQEGYRIIAIDPLRVLEGTLGIDLYPKTTPFTTAHAKDFLAMHYYTNLAQKYNDLCILVSLHHGKNKRDHNTQDPGDMIAGTTGYGAGVVTTISLLPPPQTLEADEDKDGKAPRRRELYVHGRYTHEMRYLVEQNLATGVWEVIGGINEELLSKSKQRYLETMINLGARDSWVSAEAIATALGGRTRPESIHKLLGRVRRSGLPFGGYRLLSKKGEKGGYRLVVI